MHPMRVTPARSNMYQAVSSQPTDQPIQPDISIATSTEMKTFKSDIDDVNEDVQELKNGMQTIQKIIQHLTGVNLGR
jgi:polyhydroxyalkanoate synthesis regulator phasin